MTRSIHIKKLTLPQARLLTTATLLCGVLAVAGCGSHRALP
jgi:hypothetical protein